MGYSKAIRNNWSSLIVTYGSMVLEGAILTMIIALMGPLSKQMNVSLSTISLLVTTQSIGTVGTVYISGNTSDKIGRKKVILLGISTYVIFLVGMYLTNDFKVAMFLSLLAGVAHGLMDSPSISMLIDIFGDSSGPAMSVVAVFFSGGGAISTIIIKQILERDLSIKLIYVIYLVLAGLLAIVVSKAKYPKKQKRPIIKEIDSEKNRVVDNGKLLRAALLLGVITFVYSSGNSIFRTWLGTYAFEVRGASLEESVGMLTYLQVGNVIGAFLFAYVLTKIHSTKVMITNALIASIVLVLFLSNIFGSVLLIMIVGAILSISFSLSLNIIGELFIDNSGQATGFIGTASMSGGMIMTFVSGRLLPIMGVEKLMWLSVGLIIFAGALAIIFRKIFVSIKENM